MESAYGAIKTVASKHNEVGVFVIIIDYGEIKMYANGKAEPLSKNTHFIKEVERAATASVLAFQGRNVRTLAEFKALEGKGSIRDQQRRELYQVLKSCCNFSNLSNITSCLRWLTAAIDLDEW